VVLVNEEAKQAARFLCSMPTGNTTLTKSELADLLKTTGGNMLARGTLYDIASRHIGADVYRVELQRPPRERGWETETHAEGRPVVEAPPRSGKTEAVAREAAGDLVTSVRVERNGGHDHVHVWNRGAKSGILIVNAGDGDKLKRRLLGEKVDGTW